MSMLDSLHVEATQMFIDQNPVTVTVMRSERVSDGAGGYVQAPFKAIATVKTRRVARGFVGDVQARTTTEGAIVIPGWTFVFLPDEPIQPGDQWTMNDHLHEVVFISVSPPWRLNAEVYEHG